ncbi:MAG: hypothetical protein H0X67_00445 [Acidobacteria bacterium]|nr:hypothetical protein [Acidobacteriota bacterium]
MKNVAVATLAAFASISVLVASELTTAAADMTPAASATEPCAPGAAPQTPAAPKNLRLSGGEDGLPEAEPEEFGSGPYVGPASDEAAEANGSHTYFNLLAARSDCHRAWHLRTQSQIDGLTTQSRSMPKVVYDPALDAARWPFLAGISDGQTKIFPLGINGTSMLLTWDLRWDKGWEYTEDGVALHGDRNKGSLGQIKSWKIMAADDSYAWTVIKTNFDRGAATGQGLGEVPFTSNTGKWLAPPAFRGGSEAYLPRLTDFYLRANTWTRMWIYVEGVIGGGIGGQTVHLSVWMADETRDPIRLYDRLPMYTTTGGLAELYMHYDSSQEGNTNPARSAWNRNVVVLRGIGMSAVQQLLQRPVR